MAIQLINTGQTVSTTPPSTLSATSILPVTPSFSIATGISIAFTAASGTGTVTQAVSAPVSAGRSFMKTFWQPPGLDGYDDDSASPFTISATLYAAQFGAPVAGQRVFVRSQHFSADGWLVESTITSAIVTA